MIGTVLTRTPNTYIERECVCVRKRETERERDEWKERGRDK